MYWSRTGSYLDLLGWLLLASLWWAGGWLISAHIFHLRRRERLFTGMGIGFLLFIVVSDLLAYFLGLTIAYWFAGIIVLGCGLGAAWRSVERPRFPLKELWDNRGQALAFTMLLLFFALINRGLTIFDEYSNLPLVGRLAAGDFPPHLYLDNSVILHYHYGLHFFAASLVRIGGLLVWSAFDLSKTLTIVLTLALAWLWLRRFTQNPGFLFTGLMLVLFASGARWLLLLLPQNAVHSLSASITLMGSARETAPDLQTAMVRPWNIESGSPFPFPFAFANGIFPPLSLALGGSGAIPQMTLILLLLLARRNWRFSSAFLYGLLLASLGLTGEYLLVMAWSGLALAGLGWAWSHRSSKGLIDWGVILLPSVLLAPFMGGVLTGIIQSAAARLVGSATTNLTFTGAALRWPPAFTSSHLGSLSIFNPNQFLVALVEVGPVILLAVPVTWLGWKRLRSGDLAFAGLAIGAWIGFLAPLLIQLSFSDRDVSRIIGIGEFAWLALGIPWIWPVLRKRRTGVNFLVGSACAIALLSGLGLFPAQLIAVNQVHYSYFIDEPDARMSKLQWEKLSRNAFVLDLSNPSRPAALFGLSIGHAFMDIDTPFPEYAALLDNPDPGQAARSGYTYIYLDRNAWQSLTNAQKTALGRACVRQLAEYRSVTSDFRRLYDVSQCK
jgi:hypothetical protein